MFLKWNQRWLSITFDLYQSVDPGCVDSADNPDAEEEDIEGDDEGDDDDVDDVGKEVEGETFREAKQTEARGVASSRWEVIITPYVL